MMTRAGNTAARHQVNIIEGDNSNHLALLDAQLDKYASKSGIPPRNTRRLDIQLLGSQQEVTARLAGRTEWDALRIERVMVDPCHVEKGLGRAIVETAEEIARQRGCSVSFSHAYDFQETGFWERLGYKQTGEVHDHPKNHTYFQFCKQLSTCTNDS